MHNNRVHDIRHCRALHFLLFTFPLEDDGLALRSRFGEAWSCVAVPDAAVG